MGTRLSEALNPARALARSGANRHILCHPDFEKLPRASSAPGGLDTRHSHEAAVCVGVRDLRKLTQMRGRAIAGRSNAIAVGQEGERCG